ncbi:MAG: succinate dehydrogenase [Deltaproteobacteria bacterium]|nr:succinate dehydrogenase [Deltaproteobacteria bacterium]
MVHSLSGVVPVGLFMVVQLWVHAKALAGPQVYHDTLSGLARLPGIVVLQTVILVSLVFHAGYGVVLAARARYNIRRYPHSGNWVYTLQRVTGLLALTFIALHAATVWLPAFLGWLPLADVYPTLVAKMSTTTAGVPWVSLAYLVGIGACAFHLAVGLWTFGVRWGLTATRRARTWSGAVVAVLGLLVFCLGANTVLVLATGWGPVGPAQRIDDATICDPATGVGSAAPR